MAGARRPSFRCRTRTRPDSLAADLFFAAVAYFILARALIARHGSDAVLATDLGGDFKGEASIVVYAVAIPLAFANSWLAYSLYVAVAL